MSSSTSLKCQVLVRNLSKRTTTKQLQQYASRYGSVIDCYLTETDSEGFIEFNDRLSVDVFMGKRPHTIDGNELQCQRCLPSNELQKPVKRIFIRGTVQQLAESRLSTYFDKYGKILTCTIPKGKRNNTFTHFGYAFIGFDDEDVVDRIIQDKPHFIDGLELEVQKAEDLTRNRRPSLSRSPSSRSSRSPVRSLPMNNNNNNNNKRPRRETPSPLPLPSLASLPPPTTSVLTMKRAPRNTDEFTIRQLEDENRRLHEHLLVTKRHYDEDMWKVRRELDDERRRYDQLKLEYDYVRRDLAHLTTELQAKSSTRHLNSNAKRDLSSRR